MTRSTLTKRLALAAGIPAAAAAGILLAAGTSAASSHTAPIHTVAANTTRSAAVTHVRHEAVELKRHHHAEPGDARGRANEPGEDVGGRANEPGEDVRGHAGEAEQGDDQGADQGDQTGDQGDDSSGHGSDNSGSGHDGSGDN